MCGVIHRNGPMPSSEDSAMFCSCGTLNSDVGCLGISVNRCEPCIEQKMKFLDTWCGQEHPDDLFVVVV